MKLELSLQIFEIHILVLMKAHSVGAPLFPADGRTDRPAYRRAGRHDGANGLFSQFAKDPEIDRSTAQCIYVFRKAIRPDSYFATQH